MDKEFNLETYLGIGVENIIKDAVKATFTNPKESAFFAKYVIASKKSSKIRQKFEEAGEHIPPFLIASITSSCNLHCQGCYARANNSCVDYENGEQLTLREWDTIFKEASEIGISFILLAGGEPFIRREIIETAAKYKNIIFPIFTNGTMFDDIYVNLFNQNRNLIPVVSMEGGEDTTNKRRGIGVYKSVIENMEKMKEKGILFGTSVTVTKENLTEVTGSEYLDALNQQGCKLVFFIEYVPVSADTIDLAPTDTERAILEERLKKLRMSNKDMLYISFPGDEKESGGCLAAGRGFFHINYNGCAEPCPFSPYSDTSLKNTSLREAIKSPLFIKLQENHSLLQEHEGGCALFEQKDFVESLL